jgi:hypothetical protein
MITSPSTMPVVKVLASQIILMMDALKGRKSMRLGATTSVAETVPSPGEDTYVEASTVPQGQPMDLIAVARVVCAINV